MRGCTSVPVHSPPVCSATTLGHAQTLLAVPPTIAWGSVVSESAVGGLACARAPGAAAKHKPSRLLCRAEPRTESVWHTRAADERTQRNPRAHPRRLRRGRAHHHLQPGQQEERVL